jgi:GMP synthase (glutamine-hydrolysing)
VPEAVAITHVPFEDLGSLSEVLLERGFAIRMLDACALGRQAVTDLNPELLVVRGGPLGAYETSAYPLLAGEIDLLRRRLPARRPTFGICLGAQLMAAAVGAAVFPGGNGQELGADQCRPRAGGVPGDGRVARARSAGAALASRHV